MKKILVYQFGAVTETALRKVLEELAISYTTFSRKMSDYHADSVFAMEFLKIVHEEKIEAVFSYDYFPLLAMLCDTNQIPYISWIYDCPLLTLQSQTLSLPCNYIFCFDALYAERLRQMGAQHCYHFPLAVRTDRVDAIDLGNGSFNKDYREEITFLGNLYNDDKNRIRNAWSEFSTYTKGFLEGIMNVQSQLYGCNLVRQTLNEQVVQEVADVCQLQLGKLYVEDRLQMVSDEVNMELSARDRQRILANLAKEYPVALYTASALPASMRQLSGLHVRGYADYEREMPRIFRTSKINLNITVRTIESGIPLRVLDILSCGGFCLTNYQPEIAQYFEDGKEIVMYTDDRDLKDKVAYYLVHDKEREEIVRKGYQKICSNFSLREKVSEMLQMV